MDMIIEDIMDGQIIGRSAISQHGWETPAEAQNELLKRCKHRGRVPYGNGVQDTVPDSVTRLIQRVHFATK